MLIGNVSRVLDYFTSRHSDIELKEISLVGLGAACLGLDQLLGNELGIPVKVPGKASGWGSTGDVYYALMGATIKPLKFVLEKEEKRRLRKTESRCARRFLWLLFVPELQ